jgi:MFS family permease
LSPWRFVVSFGLVSLLADMVYESARSIIGPYLASLGASAVLVGVVTGLGEALAFAGRLGTGPLADRTHAYWNLTMVGYGLTAISAPLIGFTSALWIAALLFIVERAGKAIRSPAKDVLLSHAAAAVGRGRGFAVHQALDQVGAFAGPLLVAGILLTTHNNYHPAFWVLAIPGVLAMAVLTRLRAKAPNPQLYEAEITPKKELSLAHPTGLSRTYWQYFTFSMITTLGFSTFGVLSFHLSVHKIFPTAAIPVIYAVAMAADAIAAVITGLLYDRIGSRALIVVPIISAAIPALAFQSSPTLAIIGAIAWGAVTGVQESTMRAAIADLVPAARRGTAYGIFAAGFGTATLIGAALTGFLYSYSVPALVAVVVVVQVVALGSGARFWLPKPNAIKSSRE